MNVYFLIYSNGYAGVMMHDNPQPVCVVEPEWTEQQAKRMAAALEKNPDIDPDELYRLAEVAG